MAIWPTRDFLYHVYHRNEFDSLQDWQPHDVSVTRKHGRIITKQCYSLSKDMAALHRIGVEKGIVDSEVTSIGKSYWGKELWALKVGNKESNSKVLILGGLHAREWISIEQAYYLAEYLIVSYNRDAATKREKRIKHLLDNRQIWFVPLANPDGHDYTFYKDNMWRQNRGLNFHGQKRKSGNRTHGRLKTTRMIGVDLNRNYDIDFESKIGNDGCFSGPCAESEPETKAIAELIRNNTFNASISYHSLWPAVLRPAASGDDPYLDWVIKGMEELINNAQENLENKQMLWGARLKEYRDKCLKKRKELDISNKESQAESYKKDLEKFRKYEFGTDKDVIGYSATGDMTEYAYNQKQGSHFTIELRPKAQSELYQPSYNEEPHFRFSLLPEDEIKPCFYENLPAALALINCAGQQNEIKTGANKEVQIITGTVDKPAKCQIVRHCWKVFLDWLEDEL